MKPSKWPIQSFKANGKPIFLNPKSPVGTGSIVNNIASNTAAGPDSIAELARALKNNVDLIYQFVYNNIDFYPFYGTQKGALGSLVDGMGGPWDQCMLMVALLQQAGYTANFVIGQIQLTPAQLQTWLGTSTTTDTPSSNVLGAAGIPFTPNFSGSTWTSTTLDHVWVQVDIAGTNYVFDPSFKTYSYEAAQVNIPTATGYVQSTFLSQAESGATITSDSILNMNRANIRSQLSTYAQNLQSYLSTNLPAASLDDVLGGKTIVQNTSPIRQTSLSYQTGTPTVNASIPDAYRVQYQINFPGIQEIFYTDQIHHQRLTLTFNSSNEGVLTFTPVGGTQQQWTGTTVPAGSYNTLQYAATFNINGTVIVGDSEVLTGGTYRLGTAFGPCARDAINYHKSLQAQYIAAGNADSSEAVLGESLGIQFYNYVALSSRYKDILGRVQGCFPINYIQCGVCGYDGTVPYFDMQALGDAFPDLNGSNANDLQPFNATAFLQGGTEGQVIRQQYAVGDADTNRIMDEATLNGITIYDANSSNWSTVQGNLSNWNGGVLSTIQTNYINNGGRVILPANGDVPVDSQTTFGYYASTPGSNFATQVGQSLGGYPTDPISIPTLVSDNGSQAPDPGIDTPEPGTQSNEPIQLWQGNYLYDRTDMTVGSGSFPYKLGFKRHYDSQQRYAKGPVGLGWTHNFNISAAVNSDAFQVTGDAGGSFAAAVIATAYVINDLSSDATSSMPLSNVVSCGLAERWMAELVTNNTVVVSFPDNTEIFVMQPSGSYAPISFNGSTVSQSAGAYTYATKTGQSFVFNTSGQIASWSWPSGVSLSFSYSGGLLSSVNNGLSRSLSFGYSGSLLTSVSDGNGRSVGYGYDGNSNLTSCTDTLSHVTTYAYASNGLLSQVFLPQNPTNAVVTNAFDTLGRVETQSDANSNLWTYYLAGSRSEEVDPQSNSRMFFFDRFGDTVRYIDQLGNETDSTYDGLHRLIQTTMPEGNSVQIAYDSKSNVLSRTMIAKPGSGLANIVNSFTFDPTWNKVHTAMDGNGNTTTFNYDPSTGNLLNVQKPQVGGLTPQQSFTYNTRGQVLTTTNETGIITQMNYDSTTEKLVSVVKDYGTSPHLNLTTSFGYDSVGNATSVTDPNSNTTSLQFDSERRLTQKTDPSPLSYVTQLGYDYNGQRTSVQRATGGTPAWQTYGYAYYLTGKLNTITDPLNYVTTFNYDSLNRLSSAVDAQSRTTSYSYDARSMLSTVKDNSLAVVDTRTYSNNGLLQTRKDGNSNQTSFALDGFDRLSVTTYADTSTEQYSYDSNSNVLTKTTRSSKTITRVFDALNRVTSKSPQGEAIVSYSYDLANRLLQASIPVVSGNAATGAINFAYDSAGRMIEETAPNTTSVQFGLDSNGNVTKVTYPDGWYATYTFDQINRITDVFSNGSSTASVALSYDALSKLTGKTNGSGESESYGYQLNNDLTSLTLTLATGITATYSMQYNNTHQMTSFDLNPGTSALSLWEPPAAATIGYVPNSVNEYTTVGGITYSYDGNGNLTSEGTQSFSYDVENHMLTGGNQAWTYDALVRPQQTLSTGSPTWIWAGNQRMATYNASGLQFRNVWGNRQAPLYHSSSGADQYLACDPVGSVVAVFNGSTMTTGYTFGPFGEVATTPIAEYSFTGQFNQSVATTVNSATSLVVFAARTYLPNIGRFMQPDPLGLDSRLNLYTYVGNDPLNQRDPLGLADWGNIPTFVATPDTSPWGDGPGWGTDHGWGDTNGWGDGPTWGNGPQGNSTSPGVGQNGSGTAANSVRNYMDGTFGNPLAPPPSTMPSQPGTQITINPDGSINYLYADGTYARQWNDGSYAIFAKGTYVIIDQDGYVMQGIPYPGAPLGPQGQQLYPSPIVTPPGPGTPQPGGAPSSTVNQSDTNPVFINGSDNTA